MDKIPFSDKPENLQDYSDECDRLSILEVRDFRTNWGRWYLEDGLICTWVVLPHDTYSKVQPSHLYYFAVEDCQTEEERTAILEYLDTVTWLGRKGMKDLHKAFKEARK